MANEPMPTYREETVDSVTHYICIVPDAGHEDGICGHWATDLDLFTQHQWQRHAGEMLAEPVAEPVAMSAKTPQAPARESKASVPEKAEAKAPVAEKADAKA
jgi:hypothetical protein